MLELILRRIRLNLQKLIWSLVQQVQLIDTIKELELILCGINCAVSSALSIEECALSAFQGWKCVGHSGILLTAEHLGLVDVWQPVKLNDGEVFNNSNNQALDLIDSSFLLKNIVVVIQQHTSTSWSVFTVLAVSDTRPDVCIVAGLFLRLDQWVHIQPAVWPLLLPWVRRVYGLRQSIFVIDGTDWYWAAPELRQPHICLLLPHLSVTIFILSSCCPAFLPFLL